MLYEVSKNGHAGTVSFLPHGRAFMIHKQKEFTSILPAYFSTDRMSSFQRQLNLYGFRRITTEGKDKGAFFHEKFINGKRSLTKQIQRRRGNRKVSSNIRRSPDSRSFSSGSSHQGLIQQGTQASRIAANGELGSIEHSFMLGSALRSGSELLGLGDGSPLSRSASASMLLQQQQLQQRFRQQREFINSRTLEQESVRHASQPP
jgi:hypothetical protein